MNQNNNTKLIIDALSMAIKNKPKQQKCYYTLTKAQPTELMNTLSYS
ncbi:hypothetical protein CRYPD_1396 [uncultured Candidatus Thioglobus sp.]|nr:hypothetical protein CRYPD_1396 [uncultured Candidatus Thioglobus sp.]